jgi:hypothetical protein
MPTDPTWLPTLSYDELELRKVDCMFVMADAVNARGVRSGVRPGDPGLTVTLAGSTINVSQGVAAIFRVGQSLYRAHLSATSPGTVAAAHATFDRIDLVYLRVWDTSFDASGLRQADAVYLAGTASATPVAPTPGGTEIYIPLATINVPHSGGGSPTVSTTIRPYTVAPGGILPVTSTTEPSAGGPGQVFYDADTDSFKYFKSDGTTKASLLDSSGGSVVGKTSFVAKTADQSVTSSTTLVNDTHLTLTVAASASYTFELMLMAQSAGGSAAGDFKAGFTFPAAASCHFMGTGPNNADLPGSSSSNSNGEWIARNNATSGSSTIPYGMSGIPIGIRMTGLLITGANSGSLRLQWAQGASDANATTLLTGSFMRMTRVA